MSKVTFFVIFGFILADLNLGQSVVLNAEQEITTEGRTKFDDDLREIVEYLKLQMKCGFPQLGIPPLAPYRNEYLDYNFVKPKWSLKGNLSDLVITGLNEFDVVVLHWNNILHKITQELNFPSFRAESSYQLNGNGPIFGNQLNFFGNGLFSLELINIHIKGSFKLKPLLSGGLAVTNFKSIMELEDVHSKSTGFMNSVIYTKLINAWIEEFVYLTIAEQDEVNAVTKSFVVPILNGLLKDITLIELITLITGLIEVDLPTEVICY